MVLKTMRYAPLVVGSVHPGSSRSGGLPSQQRAALAMGEGRAFAADETDQAAAIAQSASQYEPQSRCCIVDRDRIDSLPSTVRLSRSTPKLLEWTGR
jgi:hypothetical protein